MLLLVSENTAKESTGVLIARFNNQSDRSFHGTKFSKKQVVSYVMAAPGLLIHPPPPYPKPEIIPAPRYHNLNYMLLGHAMESLDPPGYREYVRQHVWGAVGIPLTGNSENRVDIANYGAKPNDPHFYDLPTAVRCDALVPDVHPSIYCDKTPDGKEALAPSQYNGNPHTGGPHGGWVASAVDTVRLLAAFQNKWFLESHLMLEADANLMFDEGRGWGQIEYPPGTKTYVFDHNGAGPGGLAYILYARDDKLAFVLLFNRGWFTGPDPWGAQHHGGLYWHPHGEELMRIAEEVTNASTWPSEDLWQYAGMSAIVPQFGTSDDDAIKPPGWS